MKIELCEKNNSQKSKLERCKNINLQKWKFRIEWKCEESNVQRLILKIEVCEKYKFTKVKMGNMRKTLIYQSWNWKSKYENNLKKKCTKVKIENRSMW